MNIQAFRLLLVFTSLCFGTGRIQAESPANKAADRPNILWITSEDNGRFLGCYGDVNAQTPNLDQLAQRGVRYTQFFANTPVCAVARSGWITGIPAVTTGTMHMRSKYRHADSVIPYPVLLRRAGYYTTNRSKTDYNTRSFGNAIWDECSPRAHFKNRKPNQPFFAVFNLTISHESQIFPENVRKQVKQKRLPENPRVLADAIIIPPYQMATSELIEDWRRVYDQITKMDEEVGDLLQELEAAGEAENTIVIYCSDHGGITPRSKRYLYDSGTHVPLIVHVPPKFSTPLNTDADSADSPAGTVNDRLVQFMDLPPTLLSLTGVDVPASMTGRIFLGSQIQPAPETLFLYSNRFDDSPDMRRGVTDGRWKYIRNYEPDLPRFQMLTYPMTQLGHQSFYREFSAGNCNPTQAAFFQSQPREELYDTLADPDEIDNLASSANHQSHLNRMRDELKQHILAHRDTGFIPEPMLAAIDAKPDQTIFGFAQNEKLYDLERILATVDLSRNANDDSIAPLIEATKNSDPIIRYWSVLGLRSLGGKALPALPDLEAATTDSEAAVRITAAMALGNLEQRDRAINLLIAEAKTATTDATANWALAGLKYLDAPAAVNELDSKHVVRGVNSARIFEYLQAGGGLHFPAPQ